MENAVGGTVALGWFYSHNVEVDFYVSDDGLA